jgi:hypothetical protein
MTREEIIKEAAADHRDCVCCGFDDPIADAQEESFIVGAEWADEHPKDGMVSLDKVEKYLRENIMMYYYSKTFDEQEKWFDDFHKVMEE